MNVKLNVEAARHVLAGKMVQAMDMNEQVIRGNVQGKDTGSLS